MKRGAPTNYFPEDDQSKFDHTLQSLYRIHDLLRECNDYSRMVMLPQYRTTGLNLWRTSLIALYKEIIPNLNSGEAKEESQKLKNRFFRLKECCNFMRYHRREHDDYELVIDSDMLRRYWNQLALIETRLRVLATQKGMLITKKSDSQFALGE